MAAKKRLWLYRSDNTGGWIYLIHQANEPCGINWLMNIVKPLCPTGLKKLTGISIPKGHVVPVESIQITLAGAGRKAKVQG